MKNKLDAMLEKLQNPNAMIAIGVPRFYDIAFFEIKYNGNEEVIELHIDNQDNYIKVNLRNAWICGMGSQLRNNPIFYDKKYIEVGKDLKRLMKEEYHEELLKYLENNFQDVYYKLDSDLIDPEEYSLEDDRIMIGDSDEELIFVFTHETNKSYNFEVSLRHGEIYIYNYHKDFLNKILRYFNIDHKLSKVNRITLIGLLRLLKEAIRKGEKAKIENIMDKITQCLHKKY